MERFAGPLTADEARHVAACARCQAEQRLYRAFADSRPGADEDVVRQIAADVEARVTAQKVATIPTAPAWTHSAWLRVAAALVLVVGATYMFWDRAPAPDAGRAASGVVRSAGVDVVAPSGDLDAAPTTFSWTAVAGAIRYDVTIREVDGTAVFSGSSTDPQLPLPDDARALMVPGKTLVWGVEAIGAGGQVLAASAAQRFRVVVR